MLSFRSRAESTGWCVKLKTVTGIRRSCARDPFTAQRVYLVLNFWLDGEPVEEWCGQFSVLLFLFLI